MDGVEGDLFDGLDFRCGSAAGEDFGEIEASDLEAVEEKACTAGVDVVGGDAAEDFADGVLDGTAIFRLRNVEGGATAATLARVLDWLAGSVVVVTKFFLTEAGAAAAASVDEDVSALIAFLGLDISVVHSGTLSPVKSAQSIQNKRPASVLRCRPLV